ncbi:hypothetical protein B0H10DRAFT_1968495 [Mycena sp. CBHHK59/15]|nr:hypothetical protein B0H10DRAFT_1968495 [Mycena sp. CBHHK59/15]
MEDSLPDEILSEILTPVLKVPEKLFSAISKTSPFASFSESTSAVLLVCKAWLRVSTPLLYNVVIIRSKAQALALDAALRKNKDLGRFIKQLRVEGGFGTAMHNILKCAPNVADIFLSLHLHGSDNPSGLVLGLPLINPKRLILFDDPRNLYKNKYVVQLTSALMECAQKWKRLTTIVFPYEDVMHTRREDLVLALCSSPMLETVSFPSLSKRDSIPPHLPAIAKNTSIRGIEVRSVAEYADPFFMAQLSTDARLKELMRWTETRYKSSAFVREERKTTAEIPMPELKDPFFIPMASAPESVTDIVWARVLFFAMIAEPTPLLRLNLLQEYAHNKKRLALPYLYGYPLFADRYRTRGFSEKLAADPSLGTHVLNIVTRKGLAFSKLGDTSLLPILSRTPRLVRLIAEGPIPMAWVAFVALATTAGASLLEFTGYHISATNTDNCSIAVFQHFRALRFLRWSSDIRFPVDADEVPAMGLPALQVLELDSCLILPVLSQMELPNLRSLVFRCNTTDYVPFLRKHGGKIGELTVRNPANEQVTFFELCLRTSKLTIHLGGKIGVHEPCLVPFNLTFPLTHLALTKLIIHKHPHRLKADEEADWEQFFSSLNPSHFLALCEIHVPSCKWPTTERAILQSFWPRWAERLLKYDIKLTDEAGTHWRPRLKAPRG